MVSRRQARLNGAAVATLLRGFADKPALQEEVPKTRDLWVWVRVGLNPKPQRALREFGILEKGPGLRIGCRVGGAGGVYASEV